MWQASIYDDFPKKGGFVIIEVLICSTLSDILALWSLESKGSTGRPNWGLNWDNDKWPTRIFPQGLTVRTDGPQVAGSPLQQSDAVCRWGQRGSSGKPNIREAVLGGVGERESETGSVINVTRITHYCSRKGTEAAFSESNLNLTWVKFCHE